MRVRSALVVATLLSTVAVFAQNVPLKSDARLSKYRSIYDKFHPWVPPTSLAEWKEKRERIRTQLLVSNGLWPMPTKTPLQAQLRPALQRDGYTVQPVMFASMPGHYVTGTLYRPTDSGEQNLPAILCPHGHWQDGRFYDAGDQKVKEQIEKGAELLPEAARHPLQARFVQLARMGCVVFHYDMVGYADSNIVEHRKQFNDADAMLWLTNKMGLQTWNSLRALDFVSALEGVDKNRIAVTGASGGGTQSFMLAAIERERIAAAFPAVMVSTGMQGGCVCENASYLRVGVNNIALAALFAPKPMAMSGADDWTIDIQKLGLPELRQVYSLYRKPTLVNAQAWPEFQHNYNMHSRHMMYRWFNEHLNLKQEAPIEERGFKPLTREEQAVFGLIPPPNTAKLADGLRTDMRAAARRQLDGLFDGPVDKVEARYDAVVGAAARVMFDVSTLAELEIADDAKPFVTTSIATTSDGKTHNIKLGVGSTGGRHAVHWVDDAGVDQLIKDQSFLQLCNDTAAVSCSDYFALGMNAEQFKELRGTLDNNQNYAGLTFCYNRPLLAERVGDVAAVLSGSSRKMETMTAVGTGQAGPIVLLAAAVSKRKIDRVIVDLNGFSFSKVTTPNDEMMLPGAMRYGDIGGLAALAFPCHMQLFGTKNIPAEALAPLKRMAKLTNSKLELFEETLTRQKVAGLLAKTTD